MLQHTNSLTVPADLEETWEFFSKPANLKLLTPPDMELKMATDGMDDIYEGLLLYFKVSPLMGIALNWETIITEVKKPHRFVDKQHKGPFAYWRHEHIFEPAKNGTTITDRLTYKMPFGPIGKLAHPVLVKGKIKELFEYRKQKIDQLFGLVEPK